MRKETVLRRWKQHVVNLEKLRRGKCVDCGLRVPFDRPYLFDFDHRERQAKVDAVSKMCRANTMQAIVEEMAKCDLVCALCHRIRTHEKRDFDHLDQPTANIHPSLFDCDGLQG